MKKNPKSRKAQRSKDWKYIGREIGIVVIGVLTAFMLNSWWINVKERDGRKVVIENLRSEMIYNIEELERTIAVNQFVMKSTKSLAKILRSSPLNEDVNVPDTVLMGVIIAATNNPAKGTINSIVSSGKLDFAKNNELITAITSWNNKLDDATEDELTGYNFIEDHFVPYLREYVDLSELFENSGNLVHYAHTGSRDRLPKEFIDDTVTLGAKLELINLVAQREMRLGITVRALIRLQDHQLKMLELINNGS
ncbi:MAG: hypothetical protein OEV74_06080 [Cyclobacteriaceae bacterium]|nr:hypothetical protein [Cyclobacteriaceae bacterium]MDH4295827.1 hypothetical protein [Cyclobacteriaceae bacterium]MDH5247672.1 hypothetical protein [Cyclobacteriaceae bacterium]